MPYLTNRLLESLQSIHLHYRDDGDDGDAI
jgi:hypothetical protein